MKGIEWYIIWSLVVEASAYRGPTINGEGTSVSNYISHQNPFLEAIHYSSSHRGVGYIKIIPLESP
jgi:hypothetical protein